MELKLISTERVQQYKEYIIEQVQKLPWITPGELALKSFYRGFIEFRFTDARSLAESTRKIYLTQSKNVDHENV